MRIGIIGTGDVGKTLGSKFVKQGNEVMMGSRTANNPKGIEWKTANGSNASIGTFTDAAAFGEIIFNCTPGMHSLEALQQAGANNLKGKILVDVANPLDFSKGMPPTLSICNTDSLAEQIQRTFPDTKVIKAFNTLSAHLMVDPQRVPGGMLFISGNDSAAKEKFTKMIKEQFGWNSVMDLGDIKTARGTEMLMPLWMTLYGKFQNADFNWQIAMK